MSIMKSSRHIIILACSSIGVYAMLAYLGHLGYKYPHYLLLFAIVFGLYLTAWVRIKNDTSHYTGWIIAVGAVIAYLLLVPTAPELSDDVYRYLWEGRVQRLGFNPFSVAPDSMLLKDFRDHIWPLVTFKDMGTIYPPFAQLVFRFTGAVHYSVVFYKIALLPFFILAIYSIRKLLIYRSMNPNLVLLFAWNPLVLVETASSGHLDIIGAALLIYAVMLFYHKKEFWSALFLALAVSAKFLPIIALPYIWLRAEKKWRFIGLFAAVIFITYLPFMGAGTALFKSLGAYSEHWTFNASIYRFYMLFAVPRIFYMLGTVLGLGGFAGWLFYRRVRPEIAIPALLCGVYLLSPVLFPWYLIWIVPFSPFFASFPLVVFTGIIQLCYRAVWVYLLQGEWIDPWYLGLIEYLIFVCILVVWWYKKYYRKNV